MSTAADDAEWHARPDPLLVRAVRPVVRALTRFHPLRLEGVRHLPLGGAYGSPSNALRLLKRGELVVCYPGGAREVLKHESDRYRCLWDRSVGFVRLALQTGAPIIPFAAAELVYEWEHERSAA